MSILALLLLAAPAPSLPPCRAGQLRLTLDGHNGDFNGMSHAGTELSIRNVGPACALDALPRVQFRDARNRALPAARAAPRGMHPGPVLVPVRLATGDRATSQLRWISGPVFPRNRTLRARKITVGIGTATLPTPLRASLYGPAGQPAPFEQTPFHAVESGSER